MEAVEKLDEVTAWRWGKKEGVFCPRRHGSGERCGELLNHAGDTLDCPTHGAVYEVERAA